MFCPPGLWNKLFFGWKVILSKYASCWYLPGRGLYRSLLWWWFTCPCNRTEPVRMPKKGALNRAGSVDLGNFKRKMCTAFWCCSTSQKIYVHKELSPTSYLGKQDVWDNWMWIFSLWRDHSMCCYRVLLASHRKSQVAGLFSCSPSNTLPFQRVQARCMGKFTNMR